MRYGFCAFSIAAPFATRQCGHLTQTEKIDKYHDDLKGRIFYLEKDIKVLHISLDLLGFDEKLYAELKAYVGADVKLITSATHTHYGNDVSDSEYRSYLLKVIKTNIEKMTIKEYGDLYYAKVTTPFDKVGKSRISGYEAHNEYLSLIEIKDANDVLLNIVIYNCHPTILSANTPYFSSEFPGLVLKELHEHYPLEDFTYLSGAMGDISSRFVREGQDYKEVSRLAKLLVKKIESLKTQEKYQKLTLDCKEYFLPYEHTLAPIALDEIRSDLSERELETIRYGEIMRSHIDLAKAQKGAKISILSLGTFKIIFYPNEIFSDYLNYININNSILVSYSNGYGPYILPVDFPYVTYEMFLDTLTKGTKERIISFLKEFGK